MSELEITKIIDDILLKSGGSIIVNKNLARNIGLDATIFYSEICSKYNYFQQKEMLDEDGYFFNTVENMLEDTSLSDYRQREAIKKLIKLGLIFYQKRGLPARRYFKVNLNDEPITRLTKNPSNQNLENCASKIKDVDLKKLQGNNTNLNNTNILNGIFISSQDLRNSDISYASENSINILINNENLENDIKLYLYECQKANSKDDTNMPVYSSIIPLNIISSAVATIQNCIIIVGQNISGGKVGISITPK